MTSIKKHIAAALTAVFFAATLTAPVTAAEAPSIRVSSYKGSILSVGERSSLIIGPNSTEYIVTSSNPDIVAVEQVLTFWVAVAKEEGSAEITVSNGAGEYGTITLTVGSAVSATPTSSADENSTNLMDNMEIRQEMVRLINQTRRAK